MADVDDGYAAYYSQRVWALLPAVYRTDDSDASGAPGQLRELLNRVGAQVAVVRRSIDRLWADQSIETCDDWVIPYIGDLLGTNLVNGLDARGRRLDVAKTIHYRRGKGTLAILEELARDVTGWDAHVVEGFRRLARTRHGLDPMVGGAGFPGADGAALAGLLTAEDLIGALTGTPAGGLADVRSAHGAALAGSPFDESFHTADLRAGLGAIGHFGIPKLLVFLWRLTSFAIGDPTGTGDIPTSPGTPVAVAGCPNQFVFDPTGREIPLFLPPPPPVAEDFADSWAPAYEWQVPGPITASLQQALTATGSTAPPAPPYPSPPPNLTPASPPASTPATLAGFAYAVTSQGGTGSSAAGAELDQVWPELGRFSVYPSSPPPSAARLTVAYYYGFSASSGTLYVGAGPYDRLLLGDPPQQAGSDVRRVKGGTGLDRALGVAPSGTVVINDSLTYSGLRDVGTTATPIETVLVQAGPQQRPVLRPAPASPPGGAAPDWVFTGGGDKAELTLDGLLVCGCDIVLRGSFDTVRITACTLDPGTVHGGTPPSPPPATPLASAVDGQPLRPTTIWIEADSPPAGSSPPSGGGAIGQLLIDHSILGPIRTRYGGLVETLTITDSIVQAIPATTGPEYSAADVYDPALLATSIWSADSLSQVLLAALPTSAQAALHTYRAPAPVPQAVVDGLNHLVTGPSLWNPALFATVAVSPDLLALAGEAPSPPGAASLTLNRGLLDAAFPVALGLAAVAVNKATVNLSRVSVLGALAAHRLTASDTIISGFANVDDMQYGCVRFSAYVGGSRVPRRYESVTVGLQAALFTSTDYGNPGYAQLLEAVDQAITGGSAGVTISAGADTGSEMGAFSSGLAPIKEQGLLTKYGEYMPLGLTPVIVHVT